MTFNPDGRTLLCGLHENLKVGPICLICFRGNILKHYLVHLIFLFFVFCCRFSHGNQSEVTIL